MKSVAPAAPAEVLRTPALPNQIDYVLGQHFAAPELWSVDRQSHVRKLGVAGMEAVVTRPRDDTMLRAPAQWFQQRDPSKNWLLCLNGSRVPAGSGTGAEPFQLETASLTTMQAIHDVVSQTVLAGERTRPSVSVDSPVRGRIFTPKNDVFWLETLIGGHWGILRINNTGKEEADHYYHDYGDAHNACNALLPAEAQDLITDAAQYDLAMLRRKSPRILIFPGEDPDRNPLTNEPYRDGMYCIDRVTDNAQYLAILNFMMSGPGGDTPQERLAALRQRISGQPSKSQQDELYRDIGHGVHSTRILYSELVDFVSRHRNGRAATNEEMTGEFDRLLAGTARVAEKILGLYEWPGGSMPEYQPPPPAQPASRVAKLLRFVGLGK